MACSPTMQLFNFVANLEIEDGQSLIEYSDICSNGDLVINKMIDSLESGTIRKDPFELLTLVSKNGIEPDHSVEIKKNKIT